MEDRKRRDTETEKIIEELNSEYMQKNLNSVHTQLLTQKMNDFTTSLDRELKSKCLTQIENLQKYVKIENNNMTYLPGKETEAANAAQDLAECSGNISSYMQAVQGLTDLGSSILSMQTEYCIEDCEKKIGSGNTDGVKSCFRNCYDYSMGYTNRAVQDLITKTLETYNQSMSSPGDFTVKDKFKF